MQVPILCTPEQRQEEPHFLRVGGRHGRELSLLPMLGRETHDEMPPLTQLNPFPWEALGWSSAAELGWAPGMEGAHGKWAALQRDSSAQEQLLCKAQQG